MGRGQVIGMAEQYRADRALAHDQLLKVVDIGANSDRIALAENEANHRANNDLIQQTYQEKVYQSNQAKETYAKQREIEDADNVAKAYTMAINFDPHSSNAKEQASQIGLLTSRLPGEARRSIIEPINQKLASVDSLYKEAETMGVDVIHKTMFDTQTGAETTRIDLEATNRELALAKANSKATWDTLSPDTIILASVMSTQPEFSGLTRKQTEAFLTEQNNLSATVAKASSLGLLQPNELESLRTPMYASGASPADMPTGTMGSTAPAYRYDPIRVEALKTRVAEKENADLQRAQLDNTGKDSLEVAKMLGGQYESLSQLIAKTDDPVVKDRLIAHADQLSTQLDFFRNAGIEAKMGANQSTIGDKGVAGAARQIGSNIAGEIAGSSNPPAGTPSNMSIADYNRFAEKYGLPPQTAGSAGRLLSIPSKDKNGTPVTIKLIN